MGWTDEVIDKARDFLDGAYEIRTADKVPSIDNVPFGKVAVRVSLTSLFVDLRRSTDLLYSGDNELAGKVHKAFLYTAVRTIRQNGGYVRSVNGDSVLAFWPAKFQRQISDAVKTAMMIKGFTRTALKAEFDQFGGVDFGAGIDYGDVYALRAGVSRDNSQNDLIFLSPSVNYSVAIGNQAQYPWEVEVSSGVHHNLEDDVRLDENGKTIWKEGAITYRNKKRTTYITSWLWNVQ